MRRGQRLRGVLAGRWCDTDYEQSKQVWAGVVSPCKGWGVYVSAGQLQ